jgi:hypothetical protein
LAAARGHAMENSATAEGRTPKPDLSTPPRGVTVSRSLISGIETVYRRINPVAFFLVPFTGLWSGFSLWGIYGSQWTSGKFDPVMSLAGLPFLIGTIFLLGMIVFLLFGSWRVHLDRGRVRFFTGVGPFGRRREIAFGADTRVELPDGYVKVRRIPQQVITVTTGERTVDFGARLPHDVRLYIAGVLREAVGKI